MGTTMAQRPPEPRTREEIRIINAFALWFGAVRAPAVLAPLIRAPQL